MSNQKKPVDFYRLGNYMKDYDPNFIAETAHEIEEQYGHKAKIAYESGLSRQKINFYRLGNHMKDYDPNFIAEIARDIEEQYGSNEKIAYEMGLSDDAIIEDKHLFKRKSLK